jgi:hypothetical protein
MKRQKPSTNPPATAAVETFGGDYHRLESTFQPKTSVPPATKGEAKNAKVRKGGGKKTA